MTTYEPATAVLAEYSDAALLAASGFKGDVAETLLSLPPEYRQPCEVETIRRTTRQDSGDGPVEFTDNPHEVRREVAAEIRAQLAQERAG